MTANMMKVIGRSLILGSVLYLIFAGARFGWEHRGSVPSSPATKEK